MKALTVVAHGESHVEQHCVPWEEAHIGEAVSFMATPDTLDVPEELRRPSVHWGGRVIDIRHDAKGRTLYVAVLGWPHIFMCRMENEPPHA